MKRYPMGRWWYPKNISTLPNAWLKGSEFKNSFDMQNIHSNSVNSMFTMKGGFQLAVTSMGGVKKGCAFKTKLWTV